MQPITRLLDIETVLKLYPVSRKTLERRIAAGKFPPKKKDGNRVFFDAEAVDQALKRLGVND